MSLGLSMCVSLECVCLSAPGCVGCAFALETVYGHSVYSVYVCLSLSLRTGKMLLASSYLHSNPVPIWASCSILPSR